MKISEMEDVSKARPAQDHSNFYIIDNSDRSFASGNSNPVNERSSPSPSLSLSLLLSHSSEISDKFLNNRIKPDSYWVEPHYQRE